MRNNAAHQSKRRMFFVMEHKWIKETITV